VSKNHLGKILIQQLIHNMHTDPIADLLTRIRNASRARHEITSVPYSKIKENILKILKNKGFIADYTVEEEGKFKVLEITLKEELANINLKRVSKPGQRIYLKRGELRPVKSGIGMSIISTSKGLMTNSEARRQNLGGELICEIY